MAEQSYILPKVGYCNTILRKPKNFFKEYKFSQKHEFSNETKDDIKLSKAKQW